jgi:hypothetical protein
MKMYSLEYFMKEIICFNLPYVSVTVGCIVVFILLGFTQFIIGMF